MIPYFFRFLKSNIKRSSQRPSEPFLLNYSITFRCNLDCKYCGVSRLDNNYCNQELSYKDIPVFLNDAMLKNLRVIVISGGEPFLKDDFNEILLALRKNTSARIFHITTNGFLTEKILDSVKFLKKNGLNIEMKVSIDDISERHDYLRNKKGSFDKAIDTIRKLRSQFHPREVFIGINQTIYEENHRSIPEVRKLAASFGVAYRGFVGLRKRPLYGGAETRDYGLTGLGSEARRYIKNELGRIYGWHSYFGKDSKFSEEMIIKHYIKGQMSLLGDRPLKPHRCMCLFTHFRMNPNGDIITCSYDLDVLGNIRNESYSSIMRKKITEEKLEKVKKCGKCWLGCEVSPNWVSSLFR